MPRREPDATRESTPTRQRGSYSGELRQQPPNAVVRSALFIFLVALIVRAIHIWQIRRAPFFSVLMGDARAYDEWAQRIAGGDWLGKEVFYQAPLYPYFLGTLYAIVGRDLLIVRLCQAIVGGCSCVLLGAAAARLFSPRAGLVAGLALALYAPAVFFDALIQKSVLDVLFICLAIWLLSRIIGGTSGPLSWLSLGLAMGGLSLTRENALVFIAVILLWGLARKAGGKPKGLHYDPKVRHDMRQRLGTSGLFLFGLSLVLAPVTVRNKVVGGEFFVTTSQFGPNFYIGNNARADGTYASLRFGRGAPEYERQDATELAERARGRKLTSAEVSGYWTERALAFITSQPGGWLKLLGRKIALLSNATEMLDTESQASHAEWSTPLKLTGWVAHFGTLVPLACLGLVLAWPDRKRLWILYALPLAYAASVVLFYVFARYRFPLVPFLVLFGAAATVSAVELFRAASTRRRAAMVTAISAVTILANWPILSTDAMRAITENNLGAAFQSDGRLDEAAAHYRRAIGFQPAYTPAHSNLGVVLRAKGNIDEAIRSLERALEIQPDYPDAHYNLGNALLDRGQTDAAVDHYRLALRSLPSSVETHNNLGIALAATGRLAEAIVEFRHALTLNPDSAKSHRNLGNALASAGTRADAVFHLRQAVASDANDAAAHYDLGTALLEMGAAREAIDEFRAGLKLSPSWVEGHNNLGIALASQGRLDEAIGEFEQALKLRPAFADAERNLAMAVKLQKERTKP